MRMKKKQYEDNSLSNEIVHIHQDNCSTNIRREEFSPVPLASTGAVRRRLGEKKGLDVDDNDNDQEEKEEETLNIRTETELTAARSSSLYRVEAFTRKRDNSLTSVYNVFGVIPDLSKENLGESDERRFNSIDDEDDD
eukprot:CAMPEP_0185271146 /NCGR_PEP_ID=MMETSP1359-20130426/44037_1 /TAXON_ID=552665 /ORGANISM="Bigelowiella longifila, Strain CCMP242" /LENGTH=137 /DNA_ID=CAMNT_0027862987 /DNA_START=33 /DNA_END=446 /DNA_ORIENTATION=+